MLTGDFIGLESRSDNIFYGLAVYFGYKAKGTDGKLEVAHCMQYDGLCVGNMEGLLDLGYDLYLSKEELLKARQAASELVQNYQIK